MTKDLETTQITKDQALNALDQVSAMYLGNRNEHAILIESLRSLGGKPTGVEEIELTTEQAIGILDKIAAEGKRSRIDHQNAVQAIKTIKLLVEKVMSPSSINNSNKDSTVPVDYSQDGNVSTYNYVAS